MLIAKLFVVCFLRSFYNGGMKTILAAILVSSFTLLAQQVESVRIPSLEDSSIRAEAVAAGPARVWDFSKGVPSDGRLRKSARVAGGALVTTNDLSNLSAPSGFELSQVFAPQGAFLFEADFVAGGTGRRTHEGHLWDSMAINYSPKWTHRGFQLLMQERDGKWTPVLYCGFSNATCSVRGPAVKLAAGASANVSFFFGANGHVVWDFCGKTLDCTMDCAGPLAPPTRYRTIIGDRGTSNYHPFDGKIVRVSITPCVKSTLGLSVVGRTAYVRGETGASMPVVVENLAEDSLTDTTVSVEQFSRTTCLNRFESKVGTLVSGEKRVFPIALETRLHPGWYPLRVTAKGRSSDGEVKSVQRIFKLGIGPRFADRMTTLMWGFEAPVEVLADFGFTHGLTYRVPGTRCGTALDDALVKGVGLVHAPRVIFPEEGKGEEAYVRKDRTGNARVAGKKGKPAPEVSNPKFIDSILPVVTADAEALAEYPAFAGVLPCSEKRDGTFPSFTTEAARYTAQTGRPVPPEVDRKTLTEKMARKLFPTGVVPDDDPILAYYRWFWSGGDGWPAYTGAIAEAYRERISRKNFFSFWDPAVRCPPRWGSGGSVDMLNQWVYAVPEPMTVAGPCEEMFAMASGRPGQAVSIMTQLICYRAQIAPSNTVVSPAPEWLSRRPLADFPTIPPDSLQEATWSMIAKPVQAIMYHGWGTIYETERETGYVFTNPESARRLTKLLREVVAPLGPMLKNLGRTPSPVAVFESFTTCAMGGPASWGWKAPAITFAQRARLDPRVVYEETILRDGLEDVKVLYAPQCSYLTPSLIEKIKAFQARGGILVADENLVTALKADVQVPVVSFERPPESDHTEDVEVMEARRVGDVRKRVGTLRAKTTMVAQAQRLRQDLAARYAPRTDSSSADLVVYNRQWKDVAYLFAINDHRTFGDYVGMWGMTMEKGLPLSGSVSLEDPDAKVEAVYELSRGGEMAFRREGRRIVVPLEYETNDGRLLAFLPKKIAALSVDAPSHVNPGDVFKIRLVVCDTGKKPVPALLPVEVRVYDAAGRELDGAGYLAATGGICEIPIQTNVNDPKGGYRVVCRDRASGLSQTVEIR